MLKCEAAMKKKQLATRDGSEALHSTLWHLSSFILHCPNANSPAGASCQGPSTPMGLTFTASVGHQPVWRGGGTRRSPAEAVTGQQPEEAGKGSPRNCHNWHTAGGGGPWYDTTASESSWWGKGGGAVLMIRHKAWQRASCPSLLTTNQNQS